ncbi:MAG TPA: hypothetical protein VLL28_12880, partial [Hyphomicrobiaceae bacterium]|nr:hypothetical protein [Hyphomicrobiaceae bacterium]
IDWAWRIRAMTAAERGASPTQGGRPLPRVKLACRDLCHGCLSLIVTPVSIVFSVLPVAVPFGLRLGSENPTATVSDHGQADLWAMPFGTQSFAGPSLLPGHEKRAILSPLGVAGMEELGVGFVAWRKLSGGATAPLLVGSDARNNRSLPGDIIAGSLTERTSPDDVDGPHCKELGILQRGDRAETNGKQVTMGILLSVLLISRARFRLLSAMTTNLALLRLRIQLGDGVFATISAIKGTGIDPRSCSAGRGRQGHGTNPGS